MGDMGQVIIPKSDQLNADDLIAGPITIKITDVSIKSGTEQPIAISFDGDNGKPYKACKSMCRVMVTAWGSDSRKYAGRSMTLYRDPSVKWGGMEVGGIRISHMSNIDAPITLALTMTRANKRPYTVKPLTKQVTTAQASAPRPGNAEEVIPLSTSAPAAAVSEEDAKALNACLAFDTLQEEFGERWKAAKGDEPRRKALKAVYDQRKTEIEPL